MLLISCPNFYFYSYKHEIWIFMFQNKTVLRNAIITQLYVIA